jgi:hypothetical protein
MYADWYWYIYMDGKAHKGGPRNEYYADLNGLKVDLYWFRLIYTDLDGGKALMGGPKKWFYADADLHGLKVDPDWLRLI